MANVKDIQIPDLGGASDVEVIEVRVQKGDTVNQEDPLITLEGDKASMDVPSPYSGTLEEITVKEGEHVNEGDTIGKITVEEETDESEQEDDAQEASDSKEESKQQSSTEAERAEADESTASEAETETDKTSESSGSDAHAGPSVRRMANELGVDLSQIEGSGPKGRIVKADIQQHVKQRMTQPQQGQGGGVTIGDIPQEDFSQYGPVTHEKLNKIKRLTGDNLHRSWLNVPHVTQFDEADITEMDAFRKAKKAEAEQQGIRLTPLAFIMKATVAALKAFPHVNSSLASDKQELIVKQYYHFGVAVDTPNGLVVPVIRDVDQKGVFQLAKELADVSEKARDKGLAPDDMKGASFTISSLGGIGGTGFTPIVNAPQVAILGVAKATMKPVYQNGEFVPRLMLPFSLSYDHRVIDGAEGVRFTQFLATRLADIRTIIL